MTNVNVRLGQALRRPIKAVISFVAFTRGTKSTFALLNLARRSRTSARVATILLDAAEQRLDSGERDADSDSFLGAVLNEMLRRPGPSTSDRARTHTLLGHVAHSAGNSTAAIVHFTQAISLDSDNVRARLALLNEAAQTGESESFYSNLTPKVRSEANPIELAELLAKLGHACQKKRQWRHATDAYHHAHMLVPSSKIWRDQYLRLRRYAPDWGFYSPDPTRAWHLTDYPHAASHGLVAPIRKLIFGWIPLAAGDARVLFKLNGTVIAETRAVQAVTLPDGREYLQFSRYLKDLWNYAGKGDSLTIDANGRNLAIIGRGEAFSFRRNDSRAEDLLRQLDEGHIFNKYGRVRPSILSDDEWKSGMFDLYARLRRDLSESLGLTLIPFYGTMLGAVRERDFIDHDNDFDTVYISMHSDPEKVQREFRDVCDLLLFKGYSLKVKPTHTWVRLPGTPHKLDIFFAWFDENELFNASYGFHGSPLSKSDEFFDFRQKFLGSVQVPVPSNAEAILGQLYGPGWRTPDPGFAHYSTSRKIDGRYHLPPAEITELHWNQFYRDHRPDQPSRFAHFVAGRFPSRGALIEFGCGSGSDGIYFANRGWQTVCSDRSPDAIARAEEALRASPGLPIRFAVADVASGDDVRAVVANQLEIINGADTLVVYLRSFLHAIDESVQETLLTSLVDTIERGFYLCTEFRTLDDQDLAKVHSQHYRRYIDHHQLVEQLRTRWGFHIEHLEAGQGLSPYDSEDHHLCRVVACRRIGAD